MATLDHALFAHLETFLTEHRRMRLREVLALRTRHVALVLDDVYQPHNVSAALRSCDAFGVQDVHLVQGQQATPISSDVAGGSDKWLTLHRHAGPAACIDRLRKSRYRIVATAAAGAEHSPETLPLDEPIALVIGHESYGVSALFLEAADLRLAVPMFGFVESFNLSVAAALCLSELTRRLRGGRVDWRLRPEEAEELLYRWTRASVANVAAIEARWRAEQTS